MFKQADSRLALRLNPLCAAGPLGEVQVASEKAVYARAGVRSYRLGLEDAESVRVSEEGSGKSRNVARLANLSRAGAGFTA